MLIVTQALGYGIGGSEKALIEMLKALDMNKFDVTVLSLSEKPDKPYIDNTKKIIYGCEDFLRAHKPLSSVIKSPDYSFFEKLEKLYLAIYTRVHKGDFSKKLWLSYRKRIHTDSEFYDVAIGYGVGLSTYYVVDRVNARLKIGWLNTSLADAHLDLDFCRKYYESLDIVVADSASGVSRFTDLYKNFPKPVFSVRNLLDYNEIKEQASIGNGFTDEFKGIRILSVGRLTEAKAFHLAIDAAKILKNKGYEFRWYIIGFGSLENQLRSQILENGLEDTFILLGSQSNPYPFFKECDIYVQTSIFEGSCITIEEAMALFKPIVTTDFPAAYEKVTDGKNGLITHMNAESIASGVERLLVCPDLRTEFIACQKENPLSYEHEMNKFYEIIEQNIK